MPSAAAPAEPATAAAAARAAAQAREACGAASGVACGAGARGGGGGGVRGGGASAREEEEHSIASVALMTKRGRRPEAKVVAGTGTGALVGGEEEEEAAAGHELGSRAACDECVYWRDAEAEFAAGLTKLNRDISRYNLMVPAAPPPRT